MAEAGRKKEAAWQDLDDLLDAMAGEIPALAGARDAAPPASFRIVDQKLPRESFRFSGRTAIHANENVHEPKPPEDPDSPFAFSMEGYWGPRPPLSPPFPGPPAGTRISRRPSNSRGRPARRYPAPPSAFV
ncbi:MAG: hypothetical protein MPW14_05910 [Candidatus Manganitrophus sp.]|nr:MAG: hypothetical protein MPW14_05910 [Candidatus Manganitrophus sp.]